MTLLFPDDELMFTKIASKSQTGIIMAPKSNRGSLVRDRSKVYY